MGPCKQRKQFKFKVCLRLRFAASLSSRNRRPIHQRHTRQLLANHRHSYLLTNQFLMKSNLSNLCFREHLQKIIYPTKIETASGYHWICLSTFDFSSICLLFSAQFNFKIAFEHREDTVTNDRRISGIRSTSNTSFRVTLGSVPSPGVDILDRSTRYTCVKYRTWRARRIIRVGLQAREIERKWRKVYRSTQQPNPFKDSRSV